MHGDRRNKQCFKNVKYYIHTNFIQVSKSSSMPKEAYQSGTLKYAFIERDEEGRFSIRLTWMLQKVQERQ